METLPKNNLTTIILAGGKSSRMGRDKALISIQGMPLLNQIATLAKQYTSQVYIITPWIERYQSIIPSDCHLIREVTPGQGPLMGFFQALPYSETEWILLLACDLPNLNAIELEKWLRYLDDVPKEAIALLPKNSKGWEPLCGFYRHRCLQPLTEFIDLGGRAFQPWLNQQYVVELSINNPQVLFNCNTPEDLQLLD
jgi:molybdenum cofactor guanylyltransferase